MNRATIMGFLGQDPELRHGPSGDAVTTLSVADTDTWRDAEGKKHEHTEWHNCVIWGKRAENAVQFLKKGSAVFIEGRMNTRPWTDKDGNKRTAHEIIVTSIKYLDRKPRETSDQQASVPEGSQPVED